MKQFPLTPTEYHNLRFDVSKLPNLAAAGPVSASILSKTRDPLTFLLGDSEVKETESMRWGSLVDCLWTTPELFSDNYIVLPEDAPQRPTDAMLNAAKPSPASIERQNWWTTFERKAIGKIVISAAMHRDACSATSMLNQNSLAYEIHQASRKQVALFGESPIMPGTQAKCLFDLLPTEGPFVDAIVDLKTTNNTSEYSLVSTMHTFDYVAKMAYYGMLAEAAGLGPRRRAILIWQNSSFPYDVHVREIDPHDMEIGRQVTINRVNLLTKLDPSHLERHYDTSLKTISLPDWARNSHLKP